jgi:hypothetical protein
MKAIFACVLGRMKVDRIVGMVIERHGEIALMSAMFLAYFLVIRLRCSAILTFSDRARDSFHFTRGIFKCEAARPVTVEVT